MYVAVKGGEKAIAAAHALQEHRRRGDEQLPELSVAQIEQQLNLAVDRVMTEGGIADRELAALALKQASGDNVEAIFLLRAYRTTLARLAVSEPVNTAEMRLERRISAFIKISPAASCLAPPTTTPIACWILPCWRTAKRRSAPPTPNRNRLRTSSACWRNRGWRKRKKTPARSRMTSPARRRFTRARARRACSS
jgi:alpha-D-ribose 1-methylphosphonate 5-triphosphate synthase subunit PhnI